MRVLHLISSGGMYGAEAVILNLSHALQRQGDVSTIASFDNASRQLHDRAVAEGLTSELVPCSGQVSPATVRAVCEAVERLGADVLHAHGYKADLYAWAAMRGKRIALVSTCHTWYDNTLSLRVYGALDRRVLRRFDRVVAVSTEVERQLRASGVTARCIRRVRNGIDMAPFASVAKYRAEAPDRQLRVGLVGRLAREKGVDVFVNAAAIVGRELPSVTFVVVGEGPDRPQIEKQITSLGLRDRMALLGHQSAMSDVYAGLDLLVSASRQEGLPVALLEGMSSGLPLIGTNVGEVPTLVLPGRTGLVVEAGNSEALAHAMLQVLRDPGKRLGWGQTARAWMEQEFSAERMTAEYRQVYLEAQESHGQVI